MNNIGYTNDQSKIDLFSIKLSGKMNQLLIGQDIPLDYLRYVIRLDKSDTDVNVANQRKNIRVSFRSTPQTQRKFGTLDQSSSSNSEILALNSSHSFSYYPSTPYTTAITIPFALSSLLQSLPTKIELDASSRPRGLLTDAEKPF